MNENEEFEFRARAEKEHATPVKQTKAEFDAQVAKQAATQTPKQKAVGEAMKQPEAGLEEGSAAFAKDVGETGGSATQEYLTKHGAPAQLAGAAGALVHTVGEVGAGALSGGAQVKGAAVIGKGIKLAESAAKEHLTSTGKAVNDVINSQLQKMGPKALAESIRSSIGKSEDPAAHKLADDLSKMTHKQAADYLGALPSDLKDWIVNELPTTGKAAATGAIKGAAAVPKFAHKTAEKVIHEIAPDTDATTKKIAAMIATAGGSIAGVIHAPIVLAAGGAGGAVFGAAKALAKRAAAKIQLEAGKGAGKYDEQVVKKPMTNTKPISMVEMNVNAHEALSPAQKDIMKSRENFTFFGHKVDVPEHEQEAAKAWIASQKGTK